MGSEPPEEDSLTNTRAQEHDIVSAPVLTSSLRSHPPPCLSKTDFTGLKRGRKCGKEASFSLICRCAFDKEVVVV